MRKYNDLQLKFDIEGWDDEEEDARERAISTQEARQISEAARLALKGRTPGWMADGSRQTAVWWQDYLQLIEHGWPWRVACYMAWAASPKAERWPKTLQELATGVLGLMGPRQIYNWRQKHATIDTVIAMMQAAPLWEHRRDVLEALVEMARTPDYKAFNDRKLFLEMTGDYTPRSKLEVGQSAGGGLEEMSDEELRRWMGGENINKDGQDVEDKEEGEEDAG